MILPVLQNAKVIAAIAASAAIFYAGYFVGSKVQGEKTAAARMELASERLNWERERMKAMEEYAASLAQARAQEQTWRETALESERENNELKKKNDVAVRAANDAARRLHDAGRSAAANSVSSNTASASHGVDRATAVALGECGIRLAEMGEQHDRCEIERRTLISAWPK